MAGALALSVAILRSLPRAEAGIAVIAYTLLSLAALIARWGSDNLVLREVARSREDSAVVVAHCIRLTALLTPVAATALALSLSARGHVPSSVILPAVVAVFPAAMSPVLGAALRGTGRLTSGSLAELGSPSVIAALGVFLMAGNGEATASSVTWMITLSYLLTLAWAWPCVRWALGARRCADVRFSRFLRSYSASLSSFTANALGNFLLVWLPLLAIGYAVTGPKADEQVAVYNAAARIAQFVPIVATIQLSYISQRFAVLYHSGHGNQVNRLARAATLGAASWGICVLIPCLLAPQSLLALFGDYADASNELRILATGAFVVVLLGPILGLLLTCGQEHAAGLITLCSISAALPVLLLAASRGNTAVAAGTAIIGVLNAAVSALWLRRIGLKSSPLIP